MLTDLPSRMALFKSLEVKFSLQSGQQGLVCVFPLRTQEHCSQCSPSVSGPCSCPWPSSGGSCGRRLSPWGLGCRSSCPPCSRTAAPSVQELPAVRGAAHPTGQVWSVHPPGQRTGICRRA